MKRILNKRNLAKVLYATGVVHAAGLLQRLAGNCPLIVTGHRVLHDSGTTRSEIDNTALLSGHAITEAELIRRLKFLSLIRTPGDPRDLATGTPGRNAFYITFDDGYRDNIEVAGPILRKWHIKPLIFLIGELVKNPSLLPWWDALGKKKHRTTLTDNGASSYGDLCQQIKQTSMGLLHDKDALYEHDENDDDLYLELDDISELHGKWDFYIGNHTMSHPNFSKIDEKTMQEEINNCTDILSDFPGYLPILAYPFGVYDDRITSYLKRSSDITMALATGYGENNNQYTVKRVNLNTRPFSLFAAECIEINGVLEKLRRKHQTT